MNFTHHLGLTKHVTEANEFDHINCWPTEDIHLNSETQNTWAKMSIVFRKSCLDICQQKLKTQANNGC
jgi:hypothetical protein